MKKIATYFVQGLLVFSPFFLTLILIVKAFNIIDDTTNEFIQTVFGNRFVVNDLTIDLIKSVFGRDYKGIGFLLTLFMITFLGFLSSTILFRGFFRWIESIVLKNSLIRMIYTSIKDLSNAFMGEKKKFNQPVLVNVQKDSGIYKLGFITQESMSIIKDKKLIAVYLPLSYAISGDLFLVERELIQPVDINSTEALKFIVSGGVTHIDVKPKANESI